MYPIGLTTKGANDNNAPSIVITSDSSGSVSNAVAFTITCSRPVTGLIDTDITKINCTTSGFTQVSANVYTGFATGVINGTMSIQIGAGQCNDSNGTGNTASNTLSFTWNTANLPLADDWTNAIGQRVFWVVGDSTAQGLQDDSYPTGTFVPPPDPTGKGYEFFNGTVNALTSAGFVASSYNGGSCWEQFCITYNGINGYKPVVVNTGLAGSQFYNTATTGSSPSWGTNWNIYDNAKAKAQAALAATGVNKLKVLMMLGINDITHSETTANIITAMASLVDRINTDFGSPDIFAVMPGISTQTPTSRYSVIKNALFDLTATYSNFHIVANGSQMWSWDLTHATGPHYSQAGQNQIGKMIARYAANARGTTNKEVRRILNQFYDDIPTGTQDTIETQILAQIANGNWDKVDHLIISQSRTSKKNVMIDWKPFTAPLSESIIISSPGFTWVSGGGITFNGSTERFRTLFSPGIFSKASSQNDAIMFLKTGVNNNGASTAANLIGNSTSGGQAFGQDGSSRVVFRLNNSANQTYTGDSVMANNTRYAIQRNGASSGPNLYKNGTLVSSKATASSTPSSTFWDVGVLNTSNIDTPALSGYNNGGLYYEGYAQNTGFDLTSFESAMEAILAVI